jgi:DNA-binding NtrC family response regulator
MNISCKKQQPKEIMQSQGILILDQEEAIRDSLQLVLGDEGYQCFTSQDKASALKLLADQDIAIVILDSALAVKTDLLKIIKNQYPDIKSIVISSYAALETCRLALMRDADEFVLKPLSFDELISIIHGLTLSTS